MIHAAVRNGMMEDPSYGLLDPHGLWDCLFKGVQQMMGSCHIYPFLHAFLFILIHSYSPDVACQSLCPVECSHRKRSGAVLPLFPLSYHFVATIVVSCYSYLSYFVDLVMSWSGSIWLHIALWRAMNLPWHDGARLGQDFMRRHETELEMPWVDIALATRQDFLR